MTLRIDERVPLAPLTTLELGGEARYFARVQSIEEVCDAVRWAQDREMAFEILAGGSNALVADEGFPGLVIQVAIAGRTIQSDGAVRASAGESWDGLVSEIVEAELAGAECLSGIPGWVGATPIQNVGAYGQEVSQVLREVCVLDTRHLAIKRMSADDCGFGYRSSVFKRHPLRWIVLEVAFQFRPGSPDIPRYRELAERLPKAPSARQIRDAVLEIRRSKSMVLDPGDPNRRSAGSFFLNPVVSPAEAQRVLALCVEEGLAASANEVPVYDVPDGGKKFAAAWLIERVGINKGERRGTVGVSSNHALALVNHGGATTAELLALADEISDRVQARFGLDLQREPRWLGASS